MYAYPTTLRAARCALCRLRASIAVLRLARTGRPLRIERALSSQRRVATIGRADRVEGLRSRWGEARGLREEVEEEEREDERLEEVEFDGDEGLQDERRYSAEEEDLQAVRLDEFDDDIDSADAEQEELDSNTRRHHPLTLLNRFTTSPSTIQLPKAELVEPTADLLTHRSTAQLKEAAHRVFGGIGLPYSTSTPALAKTMQAKPIAIDAYQSTMSEMDADVFMAVLFPGMFAAVTAVLVETRKRLGTAWAESVVHKAARGELRILDAGAGGAGVLAVRELLRAEWERMHDGPAGPPAEADGRAGGVGASPPLGSATVLTASETLRHRASKLLEDTTFIPRLPDYAHAEEAGKRGKYDFVIAPHTLWRIREEHMRKAHVLNLWSLASVEGGVLALLEKGVARGFEAVAAARDMLLRSRIASPGSADGSTSHTLDADPSASLSSNGDDKEKAMLIAPCTNHAACPMYVPQGTVKGRRDFCHFEQKYIRPPVLQRILGARGKNWEDVKFSYFSAMRGRDLREAEGGGGGGGLLRQDEAATDLAFEGYEALDDTDPPPHPLTLPRAVLAPIKRKGHVILDLCTPAGTLERWIVPQSFSRQAYRDAVKSSWGDLWPLGAKTRVPRRPKTKKRPPKGASEADAHAAARTEPGVDEQGYLVFGDEGPAAEEGRPHASAGPGEGGRMRRGRKIKGLRDKRDKKGDGRGRRKNHDPWDD